MNALNVRVVTSALALSTLAGTVFGQAVVYTYNGNSVNDGNWNRGINWDGAQAPVDGGTNVIVNFAAIRQPNSVVDRVTPGNTFYPINGLTFANQPGLNNFPAINLTGVQLRMVPQANGVIPTIVHNTNGRVHTINNAIELRGTLGISGAANAASQLRLAGAITQVGGARAVNVTMPNGASVYMGGTNTYSGETTLYGGAIEIGNNDALGTGALILYDSAAAPHIYGAPDATFAIPNGVYILGTSAAPTFGRDTSAFGSLRINGLFNANTANPAVPDLPAGSPGFPNGRIGTPNTRRINLAGGSYNRDQNHTLILGGGIQLLAGTTLNIHGDLAPNLNPNGTFVTRRAAPGVSAIEKIDSQGSTMVWAAGFTNALAGNVNFRRGTLDIQGDLGTAAAPLRAVITIGDGTDANRAAVIGRQRVAPGPRGRPGVPALTMHFAGAGGLTPSGVAINARARLQPGASPGLMAISNGFVQMEPGSSFGTTLNGVEPGDGEGFYGQLLLQDGATMTLAASPTGERPILAMDLLTYFPSSNLDNIPFMLALQDALNPLHSPVQFVIIDQDVSAAPSLYTPADQFGYGGTMFMTAMGNPLFEGAQFGDENLPAGMAFQISYFGGDTGNDVVLTIVPAPGTAGLFGLTGLAALRRKRR